jgi:hypothetical protein
MPAGAGGDLPHYLVELRGSEVVLSLPQKKTTRKDANKKGQGIEALKKR